MFRTIGVSRGFRTIIVGLIAGVAALAVAVDSADARGKKKKKRHYGKSHHSKTHHAKKGRGYNPPYAAIVVDANSGKVLHSAESDGIRHPASLTKIMTLYMLFERIEAGKIKLDSPLKVSSHAAGQSPTKLGLKEGQTITADEAIRGLVTRSANDAAVVIAEAIAGDEDDFAKLMTRKARALGMTRTVYKNASGLPDRDQVTTARDQAQLGRAIQDRFPKYYRYFSTPSFTFRGKAIRNHNNLLGSVPGVDGIKTGYTHASGFNLVTSIKRNNHYLVAVVLGGSSGSARDARMRSLVEKYVGDGATQRTAALITEAPEGTIPVDVAAVADTAAPAPATPLPAKSISAAAKPVGQAEPATTAALPAAKSPSEPIKPIAVKTIKVKLSGVQTAALTPPLTHLPVVPVKGEIVAANAAAPAPVAQPAAPTTPTVAAKPTPAAPAPAAPAPAPAAVAPAPAPAPAAVVPAPAPATAVAVAAPAPARAPIQVASAEPDQIPVSAITPAPEPTTRKVTYTGWMIQVGAFEAEREAKDRLSSAQTKAKHLLARADAFTETVVKDNRTFFRARFAGFQKDEAEAACKYLKRNDFACLTLKN
jgi:D-alanyl-D-alanine carboxypeptidase